MTTISSCTHLARTSTRSHQTSTVSSVQNSKVTQRFNEENLLGQLRNYQAQSHSSFSIIRHFLPHPGRILPALTFNCHRTWVVNPDRILPGFGSFRITRILPCAFSYHHTLKFLLKAKSFFLRSPKITIILGKILSLNQFANSFETAANFSKWFSELKTCPPFQFTFLLIYDLNPFLKKAKIKLI